MLVRSISVSFQKKLPHPNIDYANMSSLVSVEAELAEEDNLAACVKKLQTQAEHLVEQNLAGIADRLKQRSAAAKPEAATEQKAAELAAKHGGGK